jgi:hypothetical protein
MAPEPLRIQIERPKLIEEARRALHDLEVSQEVIWRLQDVIDDERRSAYSARARLRAILKHAGVTVGDTDVEVEGAAARLVSEAGNA